MRKFIFHIVFLTMLCLLLANCKHEPYHDPATCGDATTIDDMKQWILFKEGTSWIYEEEASGVRDTVIVTNHFDGMSEGFRAFRTIMHSRLDGFDYDYWFQDSYSNQCDWAEYCTCMKIYCAKSQPGNSFGEDRTLVFPIKQGNYQGQFWGGGDFGYIRIPVYPTTALLPFDTLANCAMYHIDNAVQHNWTEVNFYLHKNIGIVRKELIELNETWNLVESSIIQ